MDIRNTTQRYGLIAVTLHWLSAITLLGLFALGWWMTGLDYYDPWYRQGPDLHRSIGVLLIVATTLRLIWAAKNPKPAISPQPPALQQRIAREVHAALYLFIFLLGISGYLISTADGREIQVFEWFSIPALPWSFDQQEDIAGDVHWWLALTLVSTAALHALAALKHHFIDRDNTLLRMFSRN